jgi:threonine synthase
MFLPSHVTVRVPATSANLGPGFDCLGLALKQYTTFEIELLLGSVERDHKPLIEIFSAWGDDPAIDALPVDSHNLFYQAFSQRLIALGMPVPSVRVRVTIGIPPGRGLGSSATAVVGGLLAADAAAGRVYSGERRVNLLDAAVELEHGKHADNIAASLLGGLVVVTRDERNGTWYAIPTFVPANLRAVLFVPNFPIDTVLGRTLLPTGYTKVDALHNVGHAALLLAALPIGDPKGIGAAMDDRFHEPYRAHIFPQLPSLLRAARAAGAYGACLSGSGPTILALAAEQAREVALALEQAARALKVDGRVVIAEIDHCGASVEVEHYRAISKIDTSQHGDIVLSCTGCETHFTLDRTDYRCDCGQPLDVALDNIGTEMKATAWRRLFDGRLRSLEAVDRSGVWRFRDLLLPLPDIAPITRPEGQTNLYPAGRLQNNGGYRRIGNFAGLDQLWIKHEGENPTGSFKDRGMTVGVSIAKWLGRTAVACASTGNTSASMAAYAAQAGLRAIVFLPEGKVAAGKLSQTIAYGAEIRQIPDDFDRAMIDVERMCLDDGIYLLNSLNPFRILGQQSLAFELLQQLGWDVPDWIALPAGNLGNTSALGMGLLRAYQLGLIPRLPRIISIQAAGANAFYQSYQASFTALHPVKAKTIATAINIGNPVSYLRAKTVIQATNGLVAQVTDDEILRAKAVIDRVGIGCEPASAASVAGVRQLVTKGIIHPTDRVVAILTGNLLKDIDAIMVAQRVARGDISLDMLTGEQESTTIV